MKKLVGFAILHTSTMCRNTCNECPYAGYKPAIAPLDYMSEIANYMKANYLFPAIDVAGKDVSYNKNLIPFLELCQKLRITTSVTLGTPHSLGVAEEVFRLANFPRVSFDGIGVEDSYRGENNYASFIQLMAAAKKANALQKLRVIFTAIPGLNTEGSLFQETLEAIRHLGDCKSKLLINPINKGGYSEKEWKTLALLGRQAQVEFSLAKQLLYSVSGVQKKCLCQAPNILTFGADQTLILPCGLLPLKKINLQHRIEAAVSSEENTIARRLCGQHKTCQSCWATCYHLPGLFLRPNWPYLFAHLPSLPPFQEARDKILSTIGQVRVNPDNRHPHCPKLGTTG